MRSFVLSCIACLIVGIDLSAHCQMPCGVYHDEIAYDQIDQYVETMHKAISELLVMKFDTPVEKNQYIRWVMSKERQSNDITNTIVSYFLQQKIKPGDEDTATKVLAAHKLLFLIVAIKQNVDLKVLYEFIDEWNKFKLMFHREDYRCKIEEKKLKKWAEEAAELKKQEEAAKKTTK